MSKVQVQNPFGRTVLISFVGGGNSKPDGFILSTADSKKKYSDPVDGSSFEEKVGILLEQFYADLELKIPKKGFNLHAIPSGHVAIEIK